MKVVIASDSYKGCMTSKEVAMQMEKGIKRLDENIETQTFAVGDGGEGTMEAFVEALHGRYVEVECLDAYGIRKVVKYGLAKKDTIAIIEVSSIVGLNQYPKEQRRPLFASTYGVGQLLLDAKKRNVKKIILALGGCSTNDGGMGMLCALGARFYDKDGNNLKGIPVNLCKIKTISLKRFEDFSNIECIAACDVNIRLLGEKGCTNFFGKQKGLYPNQRKKIEEGMCHYAYKMKQKGYDLDSIEGGGAAGGLGAAYLGLLHAKMYKGIELLFSYNHIEEAIADADLVITGEGQSDAQTYYGKLPVGVVNIANKYHKPCICISGALGLEYKKLYELGFIGIYSVADRAMSFEQALAQAKDKLEACTYNVMKTILYFYK